MEKEDIKQKINNYIEIRKNIWTSVIVLTGSLAALIINIADSKFLISGYLKIIFVVIGGIIDYAFISGINSMNNEINKLITKLGKEDKL